MRSVRRRWIGIGMGIGLLLVSVTAVYATIATKGPFTNPDAGLTDTQRDQNYASARTEFESRYAQWIASLDISKVDLTAVPHVEMNVVVLPGQPTLAAAKARADIIVVGTVAGLKPMVSGTAVSVAVARTLKGQESSSITVRQASGFRPTPDWKGIMIADSPGEPLLLPGTRFELFLERSSDGSLEIQSVTGMYYFTPNGVKALGSSPFASSVDGQSEVQFQAVTGSTAT